MTSSKRPVPAALAFAVGLCTATLSERSSGMDPFEIQVYQADINAPRHFGLEVHANYTIAGRQQAAYPGEQPPNHVLRLTLEPALGITEFFELGAYLQNMMNDDGQYRFAGVKLRGKFVLPEHYTHRFFFGLIMGALAWRTGGLEASIGAHIANNLGAFLWAALTSSVAQARAIQELTWLGAGEEIAAFAALLPALVFHGGKGRFEPSIPPESEYHTPGNKGHEGQ